MKYIYDMDKVVLERNAGDTTVASYTHEGGSLYYDLISVERSNSDYWYLFDGLGSLTELVDSDEDTQNSYRYEAFGQIKSSTENVTNYYKYVGAFGVQWDSGPALYFMQARYYMPTTGRFITLDPMRGAPQDPPSLHRYLYVANCPSSNTDPRGVFPWADFACEVICGFLCVTFLPWVTPIGCALVCMGICIALFPDEAGALLPTLRDHFPKPPAPSCRWR